MKTRSFEGRPSLELVRPMLWWAAAAFAAGFGGYCVLAVKALPPLLTL